MIGTAHDTSQRLSREFPDLEKSVKKLLDSGIPHLDVAERFKLPLILAHAIALQGKGDQKRMKQLGITLQPYDVWQFAKCGDLFGTAWPGRIPGQLIAHFWGETENFHFSVSADFAKGHTPATVAQRYGLPLILAWALKLEGLEDAEKMAALGITLQPYDVWTFARCDDLYGQEWPGSCPGSRPAVSSL